MSETESIELPIEGFELLIRSAAQGIINELSRTGTVSDISKGVDIEFLRTQLGRLIELVDKLESLQQRKKQNA